MKIKLYCEKCTKHLLTVHNAKVLEVGCDGVNLIYSESLNKPNDILTYNQHNPNEAVIVCPNCGHIEPITGINYID